MVLLNPAAMNQTRPGQQVRVGLVQINNSFSGQHYLPLSAGMLQAHAQQHLNQPNDFLFLPPIHSRIPVDIAVQHLSDADIIFFSTYVWNVRISLEIARLLKVQKPGTLVVFGGPQVPDRAEAFLKKNIFIDLVCHGEGEMIGTTILENNTSRNWENIPSISFLNRDGSFVTNPKAQRIRELAACPSPYLTGVFEPLMESNPQTQWIALWETNRGCPFSCTFCDWGSATQSKVHQFDLERIRHEIDWFAEHKIEFIFCCDANFGILPRDIEIASYVAETKKKYGYPQALSVQNTKNATERAYETQKILADNGLNKGVDIALQSMDSNTLKSIKRGNISTETYQELQRRFTKEHVDTYTDLILGLPGETYETFVNAVSMIIENGQHNRIQFNNLSILPNAEMGDPDYQKKYGMETVISKVVNIHGSLDDEEEIYEEQELVIATHSMPRDEWVRTRAFCWMTAFLYFNKVFQVPLTVLRVYCGMRPRVFLELFAENDLGNYPVLSEIRSFFRNKALQIQNGGPEYVQSREWLNIWWPADEYCLIKLVVESRLDAFYNEVGTLLERCAQERGLDLPPRLLSEAIWVNKNLIKQPFVTEDLDLDLSFNIIEFYQAALKGDNISLEKRAKKYHIDRSSQGWPTWDKWYREVIWWGNKKGAYLYGAHPSAFEFSGHF